KRLRSIRSVKIYQSTAIPRSARKPKATQPDISVNQPGAKKTCATSILFFSVDCLHEQHEVSLAAKINYMTASEQDQGRWLHDGKSAAAAVLDRVQQIGRRGPYRKDEQ